MSKTLVVLPTPVKIQGEEFLQNLLGIALIFAGCHCCATVDEGCVE